MLTSEQIDKIAPALLAAQTAIGGVVKDKTGKIQTRTGTGYEYKYSDLASVIEAVKPHLNEAGIVVLQAVSGDAAGVAVETVLMHSSGQWVSERIYMPVVGTAQAMGSAITYCKRYGLQSLMLVPSEDDDGEAASKERTERKSPLPGAMSGADVNRAELAAMSPEQQDYIRTEAAEVKRLHAAGMSVYDYVESRHLDAEEKMALWSLLPSDIRSAIKRGAPKPSLASQP